jgi:hypothetical protein
MQPGIKKMKLSPRGAQRRHNYGHVLSRNGSDMLVPDNPFAIDDKGFRNARRANRQLDRRIHIRSDRAIRIAVLAEESIDVGRPVADRDAFDDHALLGQLRQDGDFGDARHAPACKNVEQFRLAGEVPRRQCRTVCGCNGKIPHKPCGHSDPIRAASARSATTCHQTRSLRRPARSR